MESKHNQLEKFEWFQEGHDDYLEVGVLSTTPNKFGYRYAMSTRIDAVTDEETGQRTYQREEAVRRAKLFAASGELLDALQNMLNRFAPHGNGDTNDRFEAINQSFDAIKKATE